MPALSGDGLRNMESEDVDDSRSRLNFAKAMYNGNSRVGSSEKEEDRDLVNTERGRSRRRV